MLLKELFGEERICGLAGNKSSGKTNNLIALIEDFRKYNESTMIYVYGLDIEIINYLQSNYKNVKEFSNLSHLSNKKKCLIIIDEFQKLKLNDKRYKEQLNDFVDFIYHDNNKVILSSANVREFNSIIGGVIERWALKSVNSKNVVNGSQLKSEIVDYKGKFKSMFSINIPKNKLLVVNDNEEIVLDLPYIEKADTKRFNEDIFKIEKGHEKSQKKVEEDIF